MRAHLCLFAALMLFGAVCTPALAQTRADSAAVWRLLADSLPEVRALVRSRRGEAPTAAERALGAALGRAPVPSPGPNVVCPWDAVAPGVPVHVRRRAGLAVTLVSAALAPDTAAVVTRLTCRPTRPRAYFLEQAWRLVRRGGAWVVLPGSRVSET